MGRSADWSLSPLPTACMGLPHPFQGAAPQTGQPSAGDADACPAPRAPNKPLSAHTAQVGLCSLQAPCSLGTSEGRGVRCRNEACTEGLWGQQAGT